MVSPKPAELARNRPMSVGSRCAEPTNGFAVHGTGDIPDAHVQSAIVSVGEAKASGSTVGTARVVKRYIEEIMLPPTTSTM